jgi:hypothetical protein
MTAPIDLEALRGHTAGPWLVSILDAWAIIDARGYVVAKASGWREREECQANAELIAAAPALLAELTTSRARDAEVEALVEKGIALIDRYQRDDEDVISRFERLAAMFQSDTGFMAPGKDTSAAAYAGEEYERQREDCWNAWCLEPIKRFRAALLPFQRSDDKGDAT